jgi:hypothetical protein
LFDITILSQTGLDGYSVGAAAKPAVSRRFARWKP